VSSDRVVIPGSELKPREGERFLPAAVNSQNLTITILLRRNPKGGGPSEEDLLSGRYRPPSREAAEAALAADPSDIAAVRSFAEQYGLRIVDEDASSRRVRVQGPVSDLERAFGVQVKQAESPSGKQFMTYSGVISVPKALGGIVTGVLGLDQRPAAVPHAQ
jgi:kumamolisin